MLNKEKIATRFNIVCADFTGDGVDDFIIVLGNTIAVYDGVNFNELKKKTFSSDNVRIAAGDVDNDGNPDLAVLYPLNSDNAQVEIYSGGDISKAASCFASVPVGELNDIKIGDVTGNGKNNVVCLTHLDPLKINNSAKSGHYLRVLEYDTQTVGSLKQVAAEFKAEDIMELLGNNTLALVRTRGAMYPADIVFMNDAALRYDEDRMSFTKIEIKETIFSYSHFISADNIIAGNFDGNQNGKEQLYWKATYYSLELESSEKWYLISYYWGRYYDLNGTLSSETYSTYAGMIRGKLQYGGGINPVPVMYKGITSEPYQYACLSAVRSAEPTKVMKFLDWQASMSEPRIYALLAAPPHYKYKKDGTEYEYNYDFGTSWGKSTLNGGGSENSSSHRARAIFGYEQEFNMPIIATKIGGIDFTTTLEFEWSNSTQREETIEKTNTFTAVDEDGVVLSANFYDTYTYEIIQSGNIDEVGSKLTISMPKQPRTMMITLPDYERMGANGSSIPNLRQLFKHTVGYPFTYPNDKSQIVSNVRGSMIYWGGSVEGDEFVGVGSGGTLDRNITLNKQSAETSGFTFDMEADLVVTVFGVKAGAGYGYNNSNNNTHIEGEGHSVSGTLAGLRTVGEAGLADFRWNLCWFKYKIDGQTFPVVYYVVKE